MKNSWTYAGNLFGQIALLTIFAYPIISHCAGTWDMEETQSTPLANSNMEALLNNRVTRAMLADTTVINTVSPSAMLPDPPPAPDE
jgi:hypothetical protein